RSYFAVVSRSAEPSCNGRKLCTEPLPNVCSPRITALQTPFSVKSCNAPETISEALALPPLTSTTIGRLRCVLRPLARYSEILFEPRPSVETTSVFRGTNFSTTFTADQAIRRGCRADRGPNLRCPFSP